MTHGDGGSAIVVAGGALDLASCVGRVPPTACPTLRLHPPRGEHSNGLTTAWRTVPSRSRLNALRTRMKQNMQACASSRREVFDAVDGMGRVFTLISLCIEDELSCRWPLGHGGSASVSAMVGAMDSAVWQSQSQIGHDVDGSHDGGDARVVSEEDGKLGSQLEGPAGDGRHKDSDADAAASGSSLQVGSFPRGSKATDVDDESDADSSPEAEAEWGMGEAHGHEADGSEASAGTGEPMSPELLLRLFAQGVDDLLRTASPLPCTAACLFARTTARSHASLPALADLPLFPLFLRPK